MNSGESCVVLRHSDVVNGLIAARPLEAIEVGVDRRAGDFARTVGAEVVENYAVVRFNAVVIADHDGFDKLVVNLIRVRFLDAVRCGVEFSPTPAKTQS